MSAAAALLLALPVFAFGSGAGEAQDPGADHHEWIAAAGDPGALEQALADHAQKVPIEFEERLQYADGDLLRVMVAFTGRDAALEAWVHAISPAVHWYADTPNAFLVADGDAVRALLEDERTAFVEPDYPVEFFMAAASVDVNARSVGGAGSGVWTRNTATNVLESDISGVSTAYTGKDIRVAIVDSGIDKTHRDFSAEGCTAGIYTPCNSRIIKSVAVDHLLPGNTPVGDVLPTTELASGHGTHVAGSVAGNAYYGRTDGVAAGPGADGFVFGAAPEADLISVKNGDSQSAGLSTQALTWVYSNAATYDIKVVTNSWGCLGGCSWNPSSATSNIVRALYNAGVLVTFAVGNDGGSGGGAEFSGYAQHPYVLGVAAYDDSNDRLASFSSRGSSSTSNSLPTPSTWTPASEWPLASNARRPDIAAPGVDIWSARTLTGGTSSLIPRISGYDVGSNGGVFPYVSMSGTSMATPVVAGAAAVIFDACPNATPLDVMRAIMEGASGSGVSKTGSTVVAQPYEVGYGKLDVRASVDWAFTQSFC